MKLIEVIGYANAVLGIAMLAVQTMIPLRVAGIAHNVLSIAVGYAAGLYPYIVQHAVLLPINAYRLYEMRKLIRQTQVAESGDHSMGWIKPFATERTYRKGETVFWRGEDAREMFYVVSGSLKLRELDMVMPPGTVVGELGFLSPNRTRTQTLDCVEDCVVLAISYSRLEQLYFQNPKFGLYFLRLTSARLFDNISRLEQSALDKDAEIKRLRRAIVQSSTVP